MIAQDKVQVNLRGLLLALLTLIVAIIYGTGAFANGDPLWFLPVFTARPIRIVVTDKGCKVELFEGEKGFDDIYLAVNESLTQLDGVNEQFGFGQGSVQAYRDAERVVELFYPAPVTIHTNYRFGHPDSLFIPISGYFANSRAVFGGLNGDYWAGALRIKSLARIAGAAKQVQCTLQQPQGP
ncbi:MAG: hypothetical protein WCF84_10200 [Anaerolineae bacterium]